MLRSYRVPQMVSGKVHLYVATASAHEATTAVKHDIFSAKNGSPFRDIEYHSDSEYREPCVS